MAASSSNNAIELKQKSLQDNSFLKKLANGPIVCAEGYIFELERRGYLQAGSFVPECILQYPEVVRQLHQDFVHAGSDVVVALTYYAHKEKLRIIGKVDLVEKMNKAALHIAKQVAETNNCIFAGDICNTNLWVKGGETDPELVAKVKAAAGGSKFSFAYDAASEGGFVERCAEILDHQGGLVVVLNPPKDFSPQGIHITHVFTPNIELPEAEDLKRWWFPYLRSIAETGFFKVNKPEIIGNGLQEAQKVLDYHASGKVSASRPILKII